MNPLVPPAVNTDVLSPMLVKELRQGMKSRSFSFSFLLMQLLMVFCMLMAVTANAARGPDTFFNGMFWFCLGATLVFITPLRAMSALQQEMKGNTLELLFLTRLGAWRIVAGKWTALYAQALLLTTAALPYLLIRYFMGGIDVAEDILLLVHLLASSAALTAIGVCISTTRAQWMRGLVIALAVMSPYLFALFFSMSRRGVGTPASASAPHPVLLELVGLVYAVAGTLLALAWAAGRIAPDAENHARWKRLLALGMIAALPLLSTTSGDAESILGGLYVLIPICADALCELPRPIPSLHAPFARRGLPGVLASFFFLPGWPSGLPFALLLMSIYAGTILLFYPHAPDSHVALLASVPGALLFPAALVFTFRPSSRRPGVAYFVIVILCFVIAMVALALHASFTSLSLMPLSLLPPVAFMLHLCGQSSDLITPLTLLVSGVSAVLLLMRLRKAWAAQRQLLREAMTGAP